MRTAFTTEQPDQNRVKTIEIKNGVKVKKDAHVENNSYLFSRHVN